MDDRKTTTLAPRDPQKTKGGYRMTVLTKERRTRLIDDVGPFKKLKPAFKRVWLEALRSGTYKQTQGFLCTRTGKMCCLGVAFDSYFDAEWSWGDDGRGENGEKGYGILDPNNIDLDGDPVIDILGLPDFIKDAINLDDRAHGRLSELNDTEKWTFLEIADWVQVNL